jgi:hypothetical protein
MLVTDLNQSETSRARERERGREKGGEKDGVWGIANKGNVDPLQLLIYRYKCQIMNTPIPLNDQITSEANKGTPSKTSTKVQP